MGYSSSLQKGPRSNLHGILLFPRSGSGTQKLAGQKGFQTLTCAFYTLSGCSHCLTKLSLWTKSLKCLPQVNFISSGTASQKEIFYIYCELPSSRCCLNDRSCLKDLYSVQFLISKSSMFWKIRKRVSDSVSGMLSQKPCVQH